MWQPGWEGSLGENGCRYMYCWALSLFPWKYHDVVKCLYFNTKENLKKRKKGTRFNLWSVLDPKWCSWLWLYNQAERYSQKSQKEAGTRMGGPLPTRCLSDGQTATLPLWFEAGELLQGWDRGGEDTREYSLSLANSPCPGQPNPMFTGDI